MKKYSYNTDKYRFRELVSELFQVDELEKIHKNKSEWVRDEYKRMTINEENTTDFNFTYGQFALWVLILFVLFGGVLYYVFSL